MGQLTEEQQVARRAAAKGGKGKGKGKADATKLPKEGVSAAPLPQPQPSSERLEPTTLHITQEEGETARGTSRR